VRAFAGWWIVVACIACVWLAIALLSGSYFLAVGVPIFLGLALLADLPRDHEDHA
jgi:hypothetical protein